jgi:hypothetical protein
VETREVIALNFPVRIRRFRANPGHSRAMSVPDFLLAPKKVITSGWVGTGAQFNQHLYAGITGAPMSAFADLEQKVVDVYPQLVRIFYNDDQESRSRDQLLSFLLAVELAQRAGARINITWQSGGDRDPAASMARFADLLYLLVARGVDGLGWVTIQNEPNRTKITPAQNEVMYRALDEQLRRLGVRDQVRFMGGDLVEANQQTWFAYMAERMSDILDAYSVHIYWNYSDTSRFEQRLTDVRTIVDALPSKGRKPVFVTEYGVRGERGPKDVEPGLYLDGTPIAQTNVAAFQHGWFIVRAAQLGFAGTIKWDLFYGKYDQGTQAYYTIGSPVGGVWPLFPTYRLLRLLTTTVQPGWKVVALQPASTEAAGRHLVAFAGAEGELTVVGLHEDGAHINTRSRRIIAYSIGGLSPHTSFTPHLWNKDGRGTNQTAARVTVGADGIARMSVPLQSMFALTRKS